jgi:hypothetical protein
MERATSRVVVVALRRWALVEPTRSLANTQAFQQSRRERKKVEMRFAHMKRILKLTGFGFVA